jgi:hypothetical protein
MAHIAFLATALSVTLFFLWRKRLDPLAVALGSSLVYFTPGLLGMMLFSFEQGSRWYTEPIAATTYVVMGIVLVALAACAAIVDLVPARGTYAVSFQSKVPGVLLAFAIVAAAISIKHTGVYFLCLDKSIVLQKIDAWYSYATLSASLCVAAAFGLRQRIILFVGFAFLIADVYAGFRTAVAISLLAIMMLSGDSLFRGWKTATAFLVTVLLVGSAFFIGKHLITPVRYATASYCETRLALDKAAGVSTVQVNKVPTTPGLTTMEYLATAVGRYSQPGSRLSMFVQSEPFVIQAMLNEVVRNNFQTDAGYLVGQLLSALPLGESVFGIDSASIVTFNSRAQPVLFPDVNFGMANSPWAQAYAAGGLWMVGAFALVYGAILGVMTLLFWRTEGALKTGVAVIAVWIGFYFHRNDIFVEVVYLKHVTYIFCASLAVAWGTSNVERWIKAMAPI